MLRRIICWFVPRWGTRTLLCLTLIFCVGLGLISRWLHHRWSQQAACAAIVAGGGNMESENGHRLSAWDASPNYSDPFALGEFDPFDAPLPDVSGDPFPAKPPGRPFDEHLKLLITSWRREFIGENFGEIWRKADFGLMSAGSDFDHLAALGDLQVLSINCPGFSDSHAHHLQRLRELKVLYLRRSNVGDPSLKHLAGLEQLQHLDISHTQITGEGLRHLACLPQLHTLQCKGLHFTTEGVAALESLPHLQSVELASCTFETQPLWDRYSTLRSLDLSDVKLGDREIRRYRSLPQLAELKLSGAPISNRGVFSLSEFPALRRVELSYQQMKDAWLVGSRSLGTVSIHCSDERLPEIVGWSGRPKLEDYPVGGCGCGLMMHYMECDTVPLLESEAATDTGAIICAASEPRYDSDATTSTVDAYSNNRRRRSWADNR